MYQCCLEFANSDFPSEPVYEYDWEYLLEAEVAGTGLEKPVKCSFSRVYIEDVDLVEMGSMNGEVDIDTDEEYMSADEGDAEIFERIAQPSSSHSDKKLDRKEKRIKKKHFEASQKFLSKISDLGLSPGFTDEIIISGCHEYDSLYKSRKIHKYTKQKSDAGFHSDPSTTESIESVKNGQLEQPHLSFEQKKNFNFGFDEKEDSMLLAKNAGRYFAKDRNMKKYWNQRFRYFSKLHAGILMDREGWFSVTPEKIAIHIADRLVRIQDCIILDGFTGVGGNSIQLAIRGALAIGIDIDPIKLKCALQNSKVYRANNRINFICGDFFHIVKSFIGANEAKKQKAESNGSSIDLLPIPFEMDAVYLSPPWGGPSYTNGVDYDLNNMRPNGLDIFNMAQQISANIVYFLPKNTPVEQLIKLAGPIGKVEIEQSMLNGKIKAIHAYYGCLTQ